MTTPPTGRPRPDTGPDTSPATASGVPGVVRTAAPVTYGELLDLAVARLMPAGAALALHPPRTAYAADHAVLAYRELLHALGDHITGLLTNRPHRLVIDEHTSATYAAATRLRSSLRQTVPDRPAVSSHAHPDSVAAHWVGAARTIRAASDLLATHTITGTAAARSPDSYPLRYLAERGPVLRRVAALVAVACESELPMRQVIAAVEATDRPLTAQMPHLGAVHDQATAIAVSEPVHETIAGHAPVLAGATVARPGIRTDSPLHEITDRVAAIRRHAWDLLHDPEPPLHALVDIARLATHIEATRFRLTANRRVPLNHTTAPKAGAWHDLWTELRALRGLTHPHQEIRDHTHRVEVLVSRLAQGQPVGADTAGVDLADPENRRAVAATLRAAGDRLTDTAPWSSASLHHLVTTERVYAIGPSETFEGTLTWIKGKPVWTPSPVSPDTIRAISAAYRQVETVSRGLQPTPAPPSALQATPLPL